MVDLVILPIAVPHQWLGHKALPYKKDTTISVLINVTRKAIIMFLQQRIICYLHVANTGRFSISVPISIC